MLSTLNTCVDYVELLAKVDWFFFAYGLSIATHVSMHSAEVFASRSRDKRSKNDTNRCTVDRQDNHIILKKINTRYYI